MKTFEIYIKQSDPMQGRPAVFRPALNTDRFNHTEQSAKDFRDTVFESRKHLNVMTGGPSRKLRRNDIRLIECVNGKPLKPRP